MKLANSRAGQLQKPTLWTKIITYILNCVFFLCRKEIVSINFLIGGKEPNNSKRL